MDKISRRTAIGTAAASMLAGVSGAEPAAAQSPQAQDLPPLKTMTLEEFRSLEGPMAADQILAKLDCKTFMECHKRMREETGIWIPELVPVFEKLDTIRGNSPV